MRYQPVNQRMRIRILQAGGLVALGLIPVIEPALHGYAHEATEILGLTLMFACVAGRMWSVLYIGSKKNLELVTAGPYSMTRNPLYFFSTLGAFGVGVLVGSLTLAFVLGGVVFLVLVVTARKEARHLETLFGSRYRDYARRTPLFWPKPSLYRDAPETEFSTVALKRTFLDALLFLMAFPLIEGVALLQNLGYLPVLITLP